MSGQARSALRALREQLSFEGSETRSASAPGRVNLVGGHTDYNGGFVLPIAIDRRTVVVGAPREDDRLRAYALDFDDGASARTGELEPGEGPRWFDYVAGVLDRLDQRGYGVGGVDLAITGDVPMGAGVASSAALEVATTAAVGAIHDLGLDDREIATVAHEAETEFVGVGCGIMDQFASTFCAAGSALFLDCRAESFDLVPIETTDVSVLVTDTGVQHELVDSAYNERVRQCAEGVEAFDRRLDDPVESLRDVSPSDFDAHADALPETVRKRCRHVISENARVQEAVEALRAGDAPRLGELMRAGHESLRTDYETSCAELDLVVDLAADHEAVLGSRMTGAGFGGSVVSLVERDAVEDVRDAVSRAYREETGIDPDVYACEPAAGLQVE